MPDFLMPALGADMETGKVVQWLVKPGAQVHSGDIVAVVETHKGAIDVEIFLDGVITDLVPLGVELPVGSALAHVQGAVPDAEPTTPRTAERATVPRPERTTAPVGPAVGQALTSTRPYASPAARRLAAESGIDWQSLKGTGPQGAVVRDDVQAAVRARSGHTEAPSVAEVKRGFDPALMRQAIASAMARSKREIPHYYLSSILDFTRAREWLEAYNVQQSPPDRLLPAVLLLKASALALREVPQLNGFYVDGAFHPAEGIHVGWAVALRGGGLVAPAIHDADRQSLPDLMRTLRDLVQRARSGGLRSSEMTDPTVTVTSLGDRGAESVLGVIYPPQVAIMGFGRVVERPWIHDGRIESRWLVQASLAADHRVSDGHLGGQWLWAVERCLQTPQAL